MGVAVLLAAVGAAQAVEVQPTVETEPVPSGGDAADDPAFWVHPTEPGLSLVIGTDKNSGLAVYDLAGVEVQFLANGELNNVDVRYGFPLGGQSVDVVAAGNRTGDTIAVYAVDPATGELADVTAGAIAVGVNEAYGFCLYRSALSGSYYAFVNDKDGNVEQWALVDDGSGHVDAVLVRSFDVGTQTEGMVADDELAALYVGEENVGIWRYDAEPDAGTGRVQVDSTDGGHLVADVEGLTIYHAGDGSGYLLASSQGSSEFVVYERQAGNEYVMTFEIGSGDGIDAVSGTDGIDVINVDLGPSFPLGAFAAQDDSNGSDNQNFKLVPWDVIASAGPDALTVDTSWNPRAVPGDLDGDGLVGILDLLLMLGAWGPCPDPPASCPADVDRDGTVGVLDLLIVLAGWN